MKVLRWLGAGLVGVVAGVVALVGVILCVTLVLLPLGIPILMLARRMFTLAGRMVVPRAVRHPLEELDKSGDATVGKLKRKTKRGAKAGADSAQGAGRTAAKRGTKAAKRGKKAVKRGRKRRLGDVVTKPAERTTGRLRKGS